MCCCGKSFEFPLSLDKGLQPICVFVSTAIQRKFFMCVGAFTLFGQDLQTFDHCFKMEKKRRRQIILNRFLEQAVGIGACSVHTTHRPGIAVPPEMVHQHSRWR